MFVRTPTALPCPLFFARAFDPRRDDFYLKGVRGREGVITKPTKQGHGPRGRAKMNKKKAARQAAREHGQGAPHAKGGIHKQKRDQHVVSAAKQLTGATALAANPISRTSSTTRAHLTSVKFASLSISPLTKRAVAEILCYETLTAVQAETLPLALKGMDLIAKARTGTGKTVAFLLPTIERLLASGARAGSGVQAVAISPTRELASQIQAEAEQLISFHPQLSSRAVVGGTKVSADVSALAHRPPSILVATPGRLNDLLDGQGMLHAFSGLQVCPSPLFDGDQLPTAHHSLRTTHHSPLLTHPSLLTPHSSGAHLRRGRPAPRHGLPPGDRQDPPRPQVHSRHTADAALLRHHAAGRGAGGAHRHARR